MNCEDRNDLLLLYAADALEAAERETLRQHLDSGCPRCAGSLAEAEATLAHLPMAVDPVQAPASVRERLMQRAAADVAGAGEAVAPAIAPSPARRSFAEIWLRPALAAGLGGLITYLAISVPMERAQQILEERLVDQEGEIRELRSEVRGAAEHIRVLTAPSIQIVSLSGTDAQPDARGRIYWDRTQETWHVYTAGMDPAGPGKTYQLWFITPDQEKISAGTFQIDLSGEATLEVSVPAGLEVAVAAVTDEPEGGSPQPTGTIQLAGAIDPA